MNICLFIQMTYFIQIKYCVHGLKYWLLVKDITLKWMIQVWFENHLKSVWEYTQYTSYNLMFLLGIHFIFKSWLKSVDS